MMKVLALVVVFSIISIGSCLPSSPAKNPPSFFQNNEENIDINRVRVANEPTDNEQLLLEYLNRMRMDPAAELEILTNYNGASSFANPPSDDRDIANALNYFKVDASLLKQQWSTLTPVQPLSWSPTLAVAAKKHAQLMDQYQVQSHQITQANESSLGGRATEAGYSWTGLGENIFAYCKTPSYCHGGWAIDWGGTNGGIQDGVGHRKNMMGSFCEIGMSYLPSANATGGWGPYVAVQDFGTRRGCPLFLLGVVYNDKDNNKFYSVGEGASGVTVTATMAGSAPVTTTTYGSGGYSLALPAGEYQVSFSGAGVTTKNITVTIGTQSVKRDYSFTPPTTGGVTGGATTGTENGTAPTDENTNSAATPLIASFFVSAAVVSFFV